MTHVVGLLIIAFMLGRVFERWRSGGMDIEEEAYDAGYDDGLDERARERREAAARRFWLERLMQLREED